MACIRRTMVVSGLLSVAAMLATPARAQQLSVRPTAAAAAAASVAPEPRPEQFAGVWVYNADESVNAATGRPELGGRNGNSRSGAARTAPLAPAAPAAPGVTAGAGTPTGAGVPVGTPTGLSTPGATPDGGMIGGYSAFSEQPRQLGPTVAMIQENRALTRDLLEVPQALTIRIAPDAVTFIDDLDRTRSYSTTGSRQKYQLGAARFNAVAEWTGPQLQKRIDAADGFRMTEVYYLSSDGQRLFVIVRVGSSRKGAPVMGVNRVYDRAD